MSTRIFRSLALASLVSLSLFAQPAPPPQGPADRGPGGPGGPLGRCLSIVNLTDAQKTSIKSILDAAKPKMDALQEELHKSHEAVRTAINATPQDACAIGNAVIKVEAAEKAIRTEAQNTKTQIEATLTNEQKLKLAGCLEAHEPPRP